MNALEYNASKRLEHDALRALGWWPVTSATPGTQEEADQVTAWQAGAGLVADGKAGPGTWRAIRKVCVPPGWLHELPNSASIRKVYGDPRERPATGGRLHVDDAWEQANIKTYTLHTGQKVRLHKAIGPEFVRLFEIACRLSGYTPKSVQTFVPRSMMWNPENPPSRHTWGIAVDFDPTLNGFGRTSGTMMHKYPAFCATFRAAGWRCGLDWKTPDPMHIEAVGG